jgi:hypothetical protein
MGRRSDFASSKVMARRPRELNIGQILLQKQSTDYTDLM